MTVASELRAAGIPVRPVPKRVMAAASRIMPRLGVSARQASVWVTTGVDDGGEFFDVINYAVKPGVASKSIPADIDGIAVVRHEWATVAEAGE